MNSGPEYPLSPIPGSQAWFSSSRPLAEYLEQGAFQSMFVVWSMLYSNYRWYAHLLAPPFSPPRFVVFRAQGETGINPSLSHGSMSWGPWCCTWRGFSFLFSS